jgi:hypothetical protein
VPVNFKCEQKLNNEALPARTRAHLQEPVACDRIDPVSEPFFQWQRANTTGAVAANNPGGTAVVYQIAPMSFQDSNGDGPISNVSGIAAVWLCPIYR